MYDHGRHEYLALSGVSIVRYVELRQLENSLEVEPPLRILGVVAAPSNLGPLDVELERQRIHMALSGLQSRGLVELAWLQQPTVEHLQDVLHRGPWHVLHFIGHGGPVRWAATAAAHSRPVAGRPGTPVRAVGRRSRARQV